VAEPVEAPRIYARLANTKIKSRTTLQIAHDAGAKRILIPVVDMMQYSKVPADLISKFSLEVYSDLVDAAFKALGIK
jgi:predicted ATP-dependent Lon-type protease